MSANVYYAQGNDKPIKIVFATYDEKGNPVSNFTQRMTINEATVLSARLQSAAESAAEALLQIHYGEITPP